MKTTLYQKKPLKMKGVYFDGSMTSATTIRDWLQQVSGMLPVLQPLKDGQYLLYVPTFTGTYTLNPGDTLIQESDTSYYPITPEDLEKNYDVAEEDEALLQTGEVDGS